jgi:hypothetical protein
MREWNYSDFKPSQSLVQNPVQNALQTVPIHRKHNKSRHTSSKLHRVQNALDFKAFSSETPEEDFQAVDPVVAGSSPVVLASCKS